MMPEKLVSMKPRKQREQKPLDHADLMRRDLWSLDDLCAYLGVKRGWAYRVCRRREIPHYKCGLYLKFKRTEIIAWIDSQARPADSL
jgi:excisionase family DNA binding protein